MGEGHCCGHFLKSRSARGSESLGGCTSWPGRILGQDGTWQVSSPSITGSRGPLSPAQTVPISGNLASTRLTKSVPRRGRGRLHICPVLPPLTPPPPLRPELVWHLHLPIFQSDPSPQSTSSTPRDHPFEVFVVHLHYSEASIGITWELSRDTDSLAPP